MNSSSSSSNNINSIDGNNNNNQMRKSTEEEKEKAKIAAKKYREKKKQKLVEGNFDMVEAIKQQNLTRRANQNSRKEYINNLKSKDESEINDIEKEAIRKYDISVKKKAESDAKRRREKKASREMTSTSTSSTSAVAASNSVASLPQPALLNNDDSVTPLFSVRTNQPGGINITLVTKKDTGTQTIISTTPQVKRGTHSMGDSNMLENNSVLLSTLMTDEQKREFNKDQRRVFRHHYVDKHAFEVLNDKEKIRYPKLVAETIDMTDEDYSMLTTILAYNNVKGVSHKTFNTFEMLRYGNAKEQHLLDDNVPCPICSDESNKYEYHDCMLKLPCKHIFCFACISAATQIKNLCPICNHKLESARDPEVVIIE